MLSNLLQFLCLEVSEPRYTNGYKTTRLQHPLIRCIMLAVLGVKKVQSRDRREMIKLKISSKHLLTSLVQSSSFLM